MTDPIARHNALSCLSHAFGILREHRAELSLNAAHIFLTIAQHPGVSQRDLVPFSGLPQSTVSRNLTLLVSADRQAGGLGLVAKQFSIDNPQTFALHLTKTGRELAERLAKAQQGNEKTTGKVAGRRRLRGAPVIERQALPLA